MFYGPMARIPKMWVEMLCGAAGISIGASASNLIRVENPRFYKEVLMRGSLGLGESYMRGWWQSDDLKLLFVKIFAAHLEEVVTSRSLFRFWSFLRGLLFQAPTSSDVAAISNHYNIGNDFFAAMFGAENGAPMAYSCAYFRDEQTILAEAQLEKFRMVGRKLQLGKHTNFLDIGCGWGEMVRIAAEEFNVLQSTGLTISVKQAEFAHAMLRSRYLSSRAAVFLSDYRNFFESEPRHSALRPRSFDAIASIGMFEHVRPENYPDFFRRIREDFLKSGGIFLLHTMVSRSAISPPDPWIQKYIFPGVIPTYNTLLWAVENSGMDSYRTKIEEFGSSHYERTLDHWRQNLQRSPEVAKQYGHKSSGQFWRMFEYYLQLSSAAFAARRLDVVQVLLYNLHESC